MSVLCAIGLLVGAGSPAAAQVQSDRDIATVTGGIDFLNRYMFRGITQNTEGIVVWPWVDLGIAAFAGEGGLKGVTINLGTWNSLHSSNNGSVPTSGWYESDGYAALTFTGAKAAFTTTYTSYTSPNDSFTHVKEVMVKLAITDPLLLLGLKPYGAIAREFGASPGVGQADGGNEAGTYLELGMMPTIPLPKNVTLAMTTKFGIGLSNYYEDGSGGSGKFGYSSMAGILTKPINAHWNVHGGVEYLGLGPVTASRFNGGDKSVFIGSIGFGFTY
jgi:hypothetical protein